MCTTNFTEKYNQSQSHPGQGLLVCKSNYERARETLTRYFVPKPNPIRLDQLMNSVDVDLLETLSLLAGQYATEVLTLLSFLCVSGLLFVFYAATNNFFCPMYFRFAKIATLFVSCFFAIHESRSIST